MRNSRVLVAEDDEMVRRLLVEYLQSRLNVCADTARDGLEALHQISTTPYDVVILDVMMPKMSGVDFLTSLKAMAADVSMRLPSRPPAVIVITAAPNAVLPNDAIEARFPDLVRGVLRKPLDLDGLGRCVEGVLEARAADPSS